MNSRVAQKLPRHAAPHMTLGVYSHANINDMADALDALPVIGAPVSEQQQKAASALAPTLAHNPGFDSIKGAAVGSFCDSETVKHGTDTKCISPNNYRGIQRKTVGGSMKEMVNGAGFEPATTGLKGQETRKCGRRGRRRFTLFLRVGSGRRVSSEWGARAFTQGAMPGECGQDSPHCSVTNG